MPARNLATSLPVVVERLHAKYPNARYELDWETPVQLLVATILAAQCTDERVNRVTKTLFVKYPDARSYADADIATLEQDLKPTGFYREKAKKVQKACKDLVDRFGGEVPRTMDEMLTLYGVARKTANVVLNTAFQLPTGVIVDTHVQRVSQRMGMTTQKNPEKIETDLMELVPKAEWVFFGPAMVLHGRYTCTFNAPACGECPFADLCPKVGVGEEEGDPDEEAPEDEEDSPTMATKKTPAKKKTPEPAKKAAPAAKAKAAEVPSLREQLPPDWREALKAEFDKPYFKKLEKFVADERAAGPVFPPAEEVFAAFAATPFDAVKVLLLGQDPYHGAGQAHGMCFSVKPGVAPPPSLVNVYKEMQDDLGHKAVTHGHLGSWASQGVFLLNTILTVKANEAKSHAGQGWETFTDAVIKALSARAKPLACLLWGGPAHAKASLIDANKHRVLKSGHPSPLSSKHFFGTKPFSSANAALKELGQPAIDWQLPDDPSRPGAKAAPTAEPAKPTPPKAAAPTPAPAAPGPGEPTLLEQLLPASWRRLLAEEVSKPSFRQLDQYVSGERRSAAVCPEEALTFAALQEVPAERVRVVILGQEPTCASDVADGLAFSSREGADPSDVVRTMGKELRRDLGCRTPTSGCLRPWARQGVLLLNSVLTVREGRPGSHANKGWEAFTDGILRALSAGPERIVFVFWGQGTRKKASLIDQSRHAVVFGEHPAQTPTAFVGGGTFSQIDDALAAGGRSALHWQLPYA